MSLLAVQSFLARLYTDSAFRARFFNAPEAACEGMGLTLAEQRQLVALDRRQVERFAQSLRQKRLAAVRELLPGSARVMGDRFARAFFDHCEEQPSALERTDEARAFAQYLLQTRQVPEPDSTLPGYFTDLLTCERLYLDVLYPRTGIEQESPSIGGPDPEAPLTACPRLSPRGQVAAFRYDMEALYPRVLRGEGGDTPPDPCFILIGKVRGALRARLKRINAATARLLMLCDGSRPLSAISDEVAAELRLRPAERRAFAAECAQLLASLVNANLIDTPL